VTVPASAFSSRAGETFRDIRDSYLVETDCHYQSTVP
jgi:hypothetical protein